jgi:hypothetical protein
LASFQFALDKLRLFVTVLKYDVTYSNESYCEGWFMDVNGGREADQVSLKQDGWGASPIIGVVVILVAMSSILIAPMAALAHHESQRPAQGLQDGG